MAITEVTTLVRGLVTKRGDEPGSSEASAPSATRDDAVVSCPHPAYREVIFGAASRVARALLAAPPLARARRRSRARARIFSAPHSARTPTSGDVR